MEAAYWKQMLTQRTPHFLDLNKSESGLDNWQIFSFYSFSFYMTFSCYDSNSCYFTFSCSGSQESRVRDRTLERWTPILLQEIISNAVIPLNTYCNYWLSTSTYISLHPLTSSIKYISINSDSYTFVYIRCYLIILDDYLCFPGVSS